MAAAGARADAARQGAARLLDAVLVHEQMLSVALGAGALDGLPPEARARAQRLATETLRWLPRADALLDPYLTRPPPLPVRNILRLAALELGQGGAAHGVVDAAVTLVARHPRHGRLRGLANAVLRRVAEDAPARWAALPIPRLPKGLRAPIAAAWGKPAVVAIEAAHAAGAPTDLTPKPGLTPPPDLAVRVLPTGSWRLTDESQISALPGFARGDWWVQDAAAAIPVRALDPQPGETVLDLCAAPGGKTMQLAAAGAQVIAVDLSPARLERVAQNLARTGLTAELRVGDAREQTGAHDAVLLDAPCSATGTIRRHPDLPHLRATPRIDDLLVLQAQMIDAAWAAVRPGGRLVYCTCSLLPAEGEDQVARARAAHPDMHLDPAIPTVPGLDPAWESPAGGLRLRPDFWPDFGGMDGFYLAVLRKSD